MKSDYIKRDAAVRAMRGKLSDQYQDSGGTLVYASEARERIIRCKAFPVVPVISAHLVYHDRTLLMSQFNLSTMMDNGHKLYIMEQVHATAAVPYCSKCGKRMDGRFLNYCDNCGAKLKEGEGCAE